jgi:flagellar protein FlaG
MNLSAVSMQDASARPAIGPAERPAPAGGNQPPAKGNVLPPAPPPPPAPSIEQAVKQIQDFLANSSRRLHFQIDDATGRTIIRVTNPETGEVVRQIPAEEVLRMSAAIRSGGFHMISETV